MYWVNKIDLAYCRIKEIADSKWLLLYISTLDFLELICLEPLLASHISTSSLYATVCQSASKYDREKEM